MLFNKLPFYTKLFFSGILNSDLLLFLQRYIKMGITYFNSINMKNLYVAIVGIALTNLGLFAQESPDTTQQLNENRLGEVEIIEHKNQYTLSKKQSVDFNLQDVGQAIQQTPSVWWINTGSRNESSVSIKGFDTRGIPLYIDGVPVYVPYDGLMDLSRFKTFGYSRIDVNKGLTPMAYGPNTIGGAINLITLKPTKKIEIQALAGAFSGQGYQYGISIGSHLKKFYALADYYHTQQTAYPLSSEFEPIKNEDGKERNNAYFNDNNMHFKLGFTPNENNEYSINVNYQTGEKGTPPYSGIDPLQSARFWKWPVWNKSGIYFLSKTKLLDGFAFKTRLYYDRFENQLQSYDDSTYSSQTKKYAFNSFYDDYSLGGNLVFEVSKIKNNQLNVSVHLKQDYHSEHNQDEPIRRTNDQTLSFGLDDVYRLGSKFKVIIGLSYNIRQGLLAEEFFANTDSIGTIDPKMDNGFNEQLGLRYQISTKWMVMASVARKSRFATMKERYSYKMGKGLPNPELLSEKATHYDFETSYEINSKLSLGGNLFFVDVTDVIQTVDHVEPGKSQMQNTGAAEYIGADLNVQINPIKWVNASLNYGYIERHNLSHPELKFTDLPVHKVQAHINIKPLKDLDFNLNALYYGDRYSTSYGFAAQTFTCVNMSGQYAYKGFELSLGLNNIFDVNYAYSEGYPAPSRNFFATLVYKFAK